MCVCVITWCCAPHFLSVLRARLACRPLRALPGARPSRDMTRSACEGQGSCEYKSTALCCCSMLFVVPCTFQFGAAAPPSHHSFAHVCLGAHAKRFLLHKYGCWRDRSTPAGLLQKSASETRLRLQVGLVHTLGKGYSLTPHADELTIVVGRSDCVVGAHAVVVGTSTLDWLRGPSRSFERCQLGDTVCLPRPTRIGRCMWGSAGEQSLRLPSSERLLGSVVVSAWSVD